MAGQTQLLSLLFSDLDSHNFTPIQNINKLLHLSFIKSIYTVYTKVTVDSAKVTVDSAKVTVDSAKVQYV